VIDSGVFERYFNVSFPVGPIAALPSPNIDPDIQRLIFDTHNELYRSLNHGRTLIVGRKGSGKTSLLYSASFDADRSTVIALDSGETADIFTRVVKEIGELSADTALVEQVGTLWTALIWGVIFKKVPELGEDALIAKYLDGFGLTNFEGAPYEIIDQQIARMKQFPPSERPVPQKIRYTKVNGIGFAEAKERANELLREKRRYVYVLMDSLESYALHKFQNTMALAGLLRCIGIFTAERSQCVLRCCIPAEKYHILLDLSENPLKDFQGSILLHWDAGELIQLSAKRYAQYLRHYEAAFFAREISFLDLNSRRGAIQFWNVIFPKEIANRNGVLESPIAYILRHTQLLPRHFLFILTKILEKSIKIDRRFNEIDGKNIVDGTFESENEIKAQIVDAYKATVPLAADACTQILPELKTLFTWDEFTNVVNKRKDALAAIDRTEVMQALIEIGAVGKFIGETERYNIGIYEYMVPHRLPISQMDKFCVHPLFTETYGSNSKFPGAKPIYTYWSENVPPDLL
jgi:hypothetical protein